MTDLQIAGLVALSTVDWPGKLAATVFCQGCPWMCPYCHNHAIIDVRTPGIIQWEEVLSLLDRRRGLLDGVVFSGGEALLQPALTAAMTEVRERGFMVGIHTAGCYPQRLRQALEAGLLDWVGLDVKARQTKDFRRITGNAAASNRTWESLDALLAHPEVSYEVRVTVFPDGPSDVVALAEDLHRRGVRVFALQQARQLGAPDTFDASGGDAASTKKWDDTVRRWAEEISRIGFEESIFRPSSEGTMRA